MDRQVTSPKRITSPTSDPLSPYKHALSFPRIVHSRRSRGTGGPVPGVNFESFYWEGYPRTPLRTFAVKYAVSTNTGPLLVGTPFTEWPKLYGNAPLQSRYPFFNERCTKGYPFLYYNGGIQKGKGFGLRGGAFVPLHVAVPLKFFSGV